MANELTVQVYAALANGKLSELFNPGTLTFDQSTLLAHAPVVVVGTSEEDLSLGDITTNGWVFMRNLDGTNYVTYGPKSGGVMVPWGRIEAGEVAAFRLEPGVIWRWVANTSSVKVKVLALND